METVGVLDFQEPLCGGGVGGMGVRDEHDIKGYVQAMGEEGRGAFCPTDHSFSPGPAPQAQQPPTFLSFPHSLNSHSWRKRHYSSRCRTGADTGCSGNACSHLGPVHMRTCTWGSLQGEAAQGEGSTATQVKVEASGKTVQTD